MIINTKVRIRRQFAGVSFNGQPLWQRKAFQPARRVLTGWRERGLSCCKAFLQGSPTDGRIFPQTQTEFSPPLISTIAIVYEPCKLDNHRFKKVFTRNDSFITPLINIVYRQKIKSIKKKKITDSKPLHIIYKNKAMKNCTFCNIIYIYRHALLITTRSNDKMCSIIESSHMFNF